MRKYCVRGGTYTDKAKTKWLSFCDVNYSYPEKVHTQGKKYSNGLSDQERFWYSKEKPTEQPKENPIVVKQEKTTKVEEDSSISTRLINFFKSIIKQFTTN